MCKTIRKILCLAFVLSISCSLILQATAANTMLSWKLDDPQNVKIAFGSSIGQYTSRIMSYSGTWETYCSEIDIATYFSGTENVYFYGNLSVYNGSYATTNTHNNNYKVITFYGAFVDATTAQQNEIIVHEMGHALGLAHCDEADVAISVMRASGFNGKARPLSDDIEGISALYWNY